MTYKYYNFPNDKIKVGGCLERSLSYFNLKPVKDDKTAKTFIDTLKSNNIRYEIKPFNEKDFYEKKGFLIWKGDVVSHVGVFDNGIYYDAYNHFKKSPPNFIISVE